MYRLDWGHHPPCVSHAEPCPLYTWPGLIFWTLVFAVVTGLVLTLREGRAERLV
jgi:hypothetical protein